MRKNGCIILFLISVAMIAHGCGARTAETKKESPATQTNPVEETALNQITLTEKAVERLGIQTTEIVSAAVNNSRLFSGEITAIPGKSITVTAPAAGTLLPAGKNISAGQTVQQGQHVYRLLILPAEKDLIGAQADLAQREVQYNTVLEKVKRTARMYEEKSGSLRAKQEAEAELAGIEALLKVAKGRVELLKGNPTAATSELSTLTIDAPISGTILNVYSSTSQVLSAGAPIMDIVSLNPVWVRIPLYAGDENRIQRGANAMVQGLSGTQQGAITARPVAGPQTSNPQASSIDLYYEIDNSKGSFRPGQRVTVILPFSGTASGNVIPFSAIIYDIHGGTWVYTNPSANVFVRQRVELKTVIGKDAVLNRGPAAGTKIVTTGAAELFGTEFEGGK